MSLPIEFLYDSTVLSDDIEAIKKEHENIYSRMNLVSSSLLPLCAMEQFETLFTAF